MAADKIYRKKLTNGGGGVFTLTLFAALFSCAAAAGDFIAAAVYNGFYSNHINNLYAGGVEEYIQVYQYPIVMAAFAFVMFIWAASAIKAKRLGREFGFMGIFVNAAVCMMPVYKTVDQVMKSETKDTFKNGLDGDKFRMAVKLMINGLPVISGLLILLAGIAVLARISHESPVVISKGSRSENIPDPKAFGLNNDIKANPNARPTAVNAEPAQSYAPKAKAEAKPQPVTEPAPEPKPQPKPAPKAEPVKAEIKAEPKKEAAPRSKPKIILCPGCGEIVQSDEFFCSNCGKKI